MRGSARGSVRGSVSRDFQTTRRKIVSYHGTSSSTHAAGGERGHRRLHAAWMLRVLWWCWPLTSRRIAKRPDMSMYPSEQTTPAVGNARRTFVADG